MSLFLGLTGYQFKNGGTDGNDRYSNVVVHYRALFDELLEVREPRQEIIAEKRVAAR